MTSRSVRSTGQPAYFRIAGIRQSGPTLPLAVSKRYDVLAAIELAPGPRRLVLAWESGSLVARFKLSAAARPHRQRRRRRPLGHAVPDEAAADAPNAPRTKNVCERRKADFVVCIGRARRSWRLGLTSGSPDRAASTSSSGGRDARDLQMGSSASACRGGLAPAPRSVPVGTFSLGCLAADAGGCGVSSCAVVCRARLASPSMCWPMDG